MRVSDLLVFVALALATPQNKCKQDACYREFMESSNPRAECSKSFVKTVTAPPVTKKTTVTVTASTTLTSTYTVGTTTTTVSALPIAARNAQPQCCNASGHSSVCSCLGITQSTTTIAGSTTTQTITVTSTATKKETVTVTHITATATVTAETSAAPCRIKEISGVNQDTGTSQNLYLTSPKDKSGLFVQTTAIRADAWYWYLDNSVLKTVNTTVIPHGNSNSEVVVDPNNNALGNLICSQAAGVLACHYGNSPTSTIFVDSYDYVALYTPQQFAKAVSDSPLTSQAMFQFDC